MTDNVPLNAKKPDTVIVPEPTPEDKKWARWLHIISTKRATKKLVDAVREGNIARVDLAFRILIYYGTCELFEVNEKYGGLSLLNHAADSGQLDMARYLISCGARVNDVQAARAAIKNGNIAMLGLLLDKGADITDRSDLYATLGNSMLHCAIEYGKPDVVRFFLKRGALVSDDAYTFSPFALAVLANSKTSVEILDILWQAGGKKDIDICDKKGWTPLHMAVLGCVNESSKCVTWLLEKGASLTAITKDGETPLQLAIRQENGSALNAIVEHVLRNNERALSPAAVAANTVSAISASSPASKNSTGWRLVAPERIHCETVNQELGIVLTAEFNFSVRERQTVSRSIQGGQPCGFSRQDFSQISDRAAVEEAWKKLKELGGEAPHPFAPRDTRNKQPLP